MKTNQEIATGLRYLADLYFAKFVATKDAGFRVRGYAFARAADAVAAERAPVGPMSNIKYCNGESIRDAIRSIATTGHSPREAALQLRFDLPEGLEDLVGVKSLSRPFLYVLWQTYDVSSRAQLVAALPRIRKDNETVYLRLYSALLADAQANQILNHVEKA